MGTCDRPSAAAEAAMDAIRPALWEGRIPCAALGVIGTEGDPAVHIGGYAQRVPDEVPLERHHRFDLASLTKVIVTTTEIMRLVEWGRVDLDDPIARHVPDFAQYDSASALRRLTIRALLAHRSGLPAVAPIYSWGGEPERLKAAVLQHPWSLGEPVYSDIGFILLGFMVARLWPDRFGDGAVGPDLLWSLSEPPDLCVATERCAWRGRVLRGEVHDENAAALGGTAGHAGLFGTIDGVLRWAQSVLRGEVLSSAALEEMSRPQLGGTRGLGWELKAPGWAGGSLCSALTLGHTGFTGTGLWIDRGRGYAWALLTNRVHPTRHRETGIQDLRRSVGNIVSAMMTRE